VIASCSKLGKFNCHVKKKKIVNTVHSSILNKKVLLYSHIDTVGLWFTQPKESIVHSAFRFNDHLLN